MKIKQYQIYRIMNRQEAKELLPIIQAFAEGKIIETLDCSGTWLINKDLFFDRPTKCYRIKPESKYRPFANTKECWQEMLKHQPFGWTKLIGETKYSLITDVNNNIFYSDAFKEYTFADGMPFGIKE